MLVHRSLLTTGALLTAAAIIAPAAQAAPVPVQAATLNWSQTNIYNALPARTFLGHTTNPGLWTMGRSNGTAVAADGATLTGPDGSKHAAVGPDSARGFGETFVFGFPATSGTYDRAAKTLQLQTKGSVTYNQYPALMPTPPAPIKINGLLVELSATSGAVYANVAGPAGAGDYPATSTPLFTLNTSNAQTLDVGDGRVVISGLVPTLGRANVFGSQGQYPVGSSGPDRSPNTWGGFSLTIDTKAPGGPTVTETIVERIVEKEKVVEKAVEVDKTSQLVKRTLSSRPFRTNSPIDIDLRKQGSKTVIGEGFVAGKKLWLIVPKGTELSGKHTLVRTSGSKKLPKSKVVSISGKSKSKKAARN